MEASVGRQRFVAVAMVCDERGRYLVQQRHDPRCAAGNGKWEFPGGCVDFGEAPADAAVRETLEETGVMCIVDFMVPAVQSKVWGRDDGLVHAIVVCFLCRYAGGEAAPREKWVSQTAWLTPEEIAELDCLDGIPAFLAALVERLTLR